jgi:uncharacterized protein YeaO (DUF488 family)
MKRSPAGLAPLLGTYRYGEDRKPGEGLRIGAARFVPRGVRREDWQRKGCFDIWLPLLAPSPELIAEFRHGHIPFATFARRYRSEMKSRESEQVIGLLAGVSLFLPIRVGCFCEDESVCHRSVLIKLISAAAENRRAGFEAIQADFPLASPREFEGRSGS